MAWVDFGKDAGSRGDSKGDKDGTVWIVIVQEEYETAIGATMDNLRRGLIKYGLMALGMVVLVVLGLWGVAYRLLNRSVPTRALLSAGGGTEVSSASTGITPVPPTETQRNHAARKRKPDAAKQNRT